MPPPTSKATAESPLAVADRVGRGVIEAVPYRLCRATSEEEQEAIFRLRYRAVVEMGGRTPEELPDGIERNEDDEDAVHVGAWEGEELVGTARVVLPREGRSLPLEREIGLQARPGDVEIGRTVIVPRLRGATGHGLVIALYAQCWLEMRALGCTELISAIPPRLVEVYRSIGFTINELGPGVRHWGQERIPVRFDVLASGPELSRIWIAGEERPDRTPVEGPSASSPAAPRSSGS